MADTWLKAATPLPTGKYASSLPATYYSGHEPNFLVAGAINGAPVWPSFAMDNGTKGIAYSQSWDLSPALSPTTYTLQSGTLPPGLSLSNITGDQGQLAGTPTTVGAYTFTLRATNSLGTSDKSFTVTISSVVGGGSWTFIA